MTNSNDFTEYYKTISDSELLAILENRQDYQPAAIEAAQKEFLNRQLPEEAINNAKAELAEKKIKTDQQKEKIKTIERALKSKGNTLLETLNPIQTGIPTTEKIIRFVAVVLSFIFLYTIVSHYGMIKAYISDIPRFPYQSFLFLFPLAVQLVAIITFWKKHRAGWILLTIYLTFSIVTTLWLLYFIITWEPSGFAVVDNIFLKPPLTETIIRLLFLVGTLVVICRLKLREVFSVNDQKMVLTIGATSIISFFVTYAGM